MPERNFTNLPASRTLTAGVTAAATALPVSSAAPLATGLYPPYTCVIDRGLATEEVVLVTAFSASSMTVTRGYDSVAYAHSTGAKVEHCASAADFEERPLSPLDLRVWREAYANRRNAKAVIATIGDSVQEGLGTTALFNGYLYRLADRIASSYANTPNAFKAAGNNAVATMAKEWTFGGTGTEADNKWYGIGLKTIDLPSGRTMQTTVHGSSFELHFVGDLGMSTPTITIDGVAYAGPNLNTASFQDGIIWNSGALPRGPHTVLISGHTNTIKVAGIKPYDGDETFGVHVYPGGRSGAMTQDWALNMFGSAVSATQNWPKAYANVAPHLIVIALTHNDYYFQTAPATYKTNLQTIIDLLRTAIPTDPSFLLEIYPKRGDDPGTITYPYSTYVDICKEIASTNADTTYFDFRPYMGEVAGTGTDRASLYNDALHPNARGYQMMSDITFEAFGFEADRSSSERYAQPEYRITNEYVTGMASTPTSGLTLFTRFRARRLPAVVGPTGQDTQLQPAVFTNKVGRLTANAGGTTPTIEGLAVTHLHNATATPAAVTPSVGTFYGAIQRYRMSSTATAGTGAGVRTNVASWFLSSNANMGGFFYVCRFGFHAHTATNRAFIGLHTATAVISPTVEPSTLVNMIGVGCDSTDTNLQIMRNDAAGTAVKTDLGASFPARASAGTWFYEFRMYSPSAGGQIVHWSMHRLNDGVVTQGTLSVIGDLPATGLALAAHVHYSNGTTAAAGGIDLQTLYIESDN